jgi:hypothetical protein
MRYLIFLLALSLGISACTDEPITPAEPVIKFKFRFDQNQVRLNSLGQISTIPAGRAAQHPDFKKMGVHYIEFTPTQLTQVGQGDVLYRAPEVTTGGSLAIDQAQTINAPEDSIFLEIPLSQLNPGTYNYIRASVAYQEYEILFNVRGIPIIGDLLNQRGLLASFVGFNTYITSHTFGGNTIQVNGNRLQGFWGFATMLSAPYSAYNQVLSGQAPAGATTVVNPLASTSPIPAGSCLVTGAFDTPLVITGQETSDITVTLSFSINNSFEWTDSDNNGTFDLNANGTPRDFVVDMGLRGMMASFTR